MNHGGSYIDSLDWIKNGKVTYPINKNNKCFQYAITVTSNYEEIIKKKDLQRMTKIKRFINKLTGKELIFHQKKMIGEYLTK